jgi:hypothetical protein
MRQLTRHFIGYTALLTLGCGGGISIQTDYNPATADEIAAYQTYSWMPLPAGREQDTVLTAIDEQRLESAIDNVLQRKGLRAVTTGTPDFKVGYHVTLQGMTDYRTINNSYGYGWGGWGYGGYGTTVSTTQQVHWTEGTLIIDIVDGATNELAWRGIATGEVDRARTPEEREELINEAVAQMFADFPPQG